MEYRFFDPGDDRLVELGKLPAQGGIAIAVRTTGYDAYKDEVLEMCVADLDGNELFSQVVKPQNIEGWPASEATGGITPADVADAPELFQFEQEISDLFENASVVVGQYLAFTTEAIESSWITLPAFEEFDLIERFCETHCSPGRTDAPATAAALDGIAGYYGIPCDVSSTQAVSATIAACYQALAAELAEQYAAKGDSYWRERDERMAEQSSVATEAMRMREKRFNQINGLLWVAGGLIFVSVIIQLAQRGGDVGFMVVCGAAAVFCLIRAIASFRQ